MRYLSSAIAITFGFVAAMSLGGTTTDVSPEEASETEENEWSYSLAITTYLAQHARDYANPVLSADRGWLHLETRYNYEALKTGSIWLGYNFSFGEKLAFELTPMLGGVFGDVTGVAPGYTVSVSYEAIELFTQGEYFVDAGNRAGNFFYNWTELSYAVTSWCRIGFALDRTKALGSDFEIRRGPLVGFKYKQIDFTTYWLSPGEKEGTFVFAVAMHF